MKTLDKNIAEAGNIAKVIKEQKETEAKNYDFNNIVQDNQAIRNISESKALFDKKKEELDNSTATFDQSKQKFIEAQEKEKAAEKANKRRFFGLRAPSSKNTKKLKEAKKETFDAKVNSEISRRELDNVKNEYKQSEQKITDANDAKARKDLTETNYQLNGNYRNTRRNALDQSKKLVDNTISKNYEPGQSVSDTLQKVSQKAEPIISLIKPIAQAVAPELAKGTMDTISDDVSQ